MFNIFLDVPTDFPSGCSTHCYKIIDGSCSESGLKSIFLEQLSNHGLGILASTENDDLQKLAGIADKIVDASEPNKSLDKKIDRLASKIELLSSGKYRSPLTSRSNFKVNETRSHSSSNSRVNENIGKINRICAGSINSMTIKQIHAKSYVLGRVTHFQKTSWNRHWGVECSGSYYSEKKFLIDTSADILLLPSVKNSEKRPKSFKLFSTSNSDIDTFGGTILSLDLGFRRPIVWNFCIAAVPYPIIGANLLDDYRLLVDSHEKRIINPLTNISSYGNIVDVDQSMICAFLLISRFSQILSECRKLTGLERYIPLDSRKVFYHIVTNGMPVSERPRRFPPEKLKAAKAEFKKLCEIGACRPSESPWATPIQLASRKEGDWRVCGDYRRLKAITTPHINPVPHMHDFSANLYGKKIFSSIDLKRAVRQIRLTPEDIPKTAVITPFGLYEFTRMTVGLRNAAQCFQRYVDSFLSDIGYDFILIDDNVIASSSPEEHENHLCVVFERLKKAGLRINPSKCTFGVSELTFLGHIILGDGIKPTLKKVRAIVDFPKPKTVVDLRRFLVMI
ncbi:uncharacterized protein LOC117175482 [Belonocnema kinseyi]|uniref:uncharacterized protein LOC117175482 n=1 Tax=Belonocnema kinseyi TaxID=2817044 RepID=UPI00143CF01F|nr:uncharacterized protein LOC117175482 [Belonocnema kinseyi]